MLCGGVVSDLRNIRQDIGIIGKVDAYPGKWNRAAFSRNRGPSLSGRNDREDEVQIAHQAIPLLIEPPCAISNPASLTNEVKRPSSMRP
jgi:hypothetical protein